MHIMNSTNSTQLKFDVISPEVRFAYVRMLSIQSLIADVPLDWQLRLTSSPRAPIPSSSLWPWRFQTLQSMHWRISFKIFQSSIGHSTSAEEEIRTGFRSMIGPSDVTFLLETLSILQALQQSLRLKTQRSTCICQHREVFFYMVPQGACWREWA